MDSDTRIHKTWIRKTSGKTEELPLHSLRHLKAGDRVFGEVAGGGGVGPAWKRKLNLVQADVCTGLVTVPKAEEEYGVAFNPDRVSLDLERTRSLRTALASRAKDRDEGGVDR